ncbi:MAG: hypothetical protein WBB19_18560 [Desulforhopalus sp.]
MNSKDFWDLESAMKVLAHDTVDSKLWAEAVEWLMVYGPPEIQQLLTNASATAINTSFPHLRQILQAEDGQAFYDIGELAQSLNIDEEEARRILKKKAEEHQLLHFLDENETGTVH